MPVQNILSGWLYTTSNPQNVGAQTATHTFTFSSQRIVAQASITTVRRLDSYISHVTAQIQSYTKADGTVVDLSSDPKNCTCDDTDVVSITFMLTVEGGINANGVLIPTDAWASMMVYLFG
jgi:hypothetical protein